MSDITVGATTCRPLLGAVMAPGGFDAGEAMDVGNACYVAGDGDLNLADASAAATITGLMVFVTAGVKLDPDGDIANNEHVSAVVLGPIYLGPDAALDETKAVYFSETAGKLTQTAPTIYRVAGYPLSSTSMLWNPDPAGAAS